MQQPSARRRSSAALLVSLAFLGLMGLAGAGLMPGTGEWELSFRAVRPFSRAQGYLYSAARSYQRSRALSQVQHLAVLSGPAVTVFYPPHLAEDAAMILKAAEAAYPLVRQQVGGLPPEPVPVIAHESSTSLQQAFGWTSLQPAAGVYWGGVVRVLAPSAWVEADSVAERARVYAAVNPLAHELTHYVLDYRTNGNYPRWFSEGLAQWVEYRVTGFRLAGSTSWSKEPPYSLQQLESDFDRLPDQALAYQVALGLVEYMADRCGEEPTLGQVIGGLSGGRPFWESVQRGCGLERSRLETGWNQWLTHRRPDSSLDGSPG